MIKGIGTDIIEIPRVARAVQSAAFLRRVFTPAEQNYCEGRGRQAASSYAARWAGKEAVLKAFGTGLRGCNMTDMEILPDELGCPQVTLSGNLAVLAAEQHISSLRLSLSHARDYATAVCVIEKEDER